VVYTTATFNGATQLYWRPLDRLEGDVLVSGPRILSPFFSPDGEWIGFYDDDAKALKKVSTRGGPALTIGAMNLLYGASWGDDDTIVVAVNGPRGLQCIPAAAGELQPALPDDQGPFRRAVRADGRGPGPELARGAEAARSSTILAPRSGRRDPFFLSAPPIVSQPQAGWTLLSKVGGPSPTWHDPLSGWQPCVRPPRSARSCGRACNGRWVLTLVTISYKMSDMRKTSVSIRELQQNLKRVLARVERGEVVEVTRHRRPVARLAPLEADGPLSAWPDLEERSRAVFGDRVVTPGGAALVIEDRGER